MTKCDTCKLSLYLVLDESGIYIKALLCLKGNSTDFAHQTSFSRPLKMWEKAFVAPKGSSVDCVDESYDEPYSGNLFGF